MKYKIVQADNIKSLIDKVNGTIEAGFEPIGGVSDCLVGTNYQGTGLKHVYSQAMIFQDKESKG